MVLDITFVEREIKKSAISGTKPEWGFLHIELDCPDWNSADADIMFQICTWHGVTPEYINNKNTDNYIGYLRIKDGDYSEYLELCNKYQLNAD